MSSKDTSTVITSKRKSLSIKSRQEYLMMSAAWLKVKVEAIFGTTKRNSSCSPMTSIWYLKMARKKSSTVKVSANSPSSMNHAMASVCKGLKQVGKFFSLACSLDKLSGRALEASGGQIGQSWR